MKINTIPIFDNQKVSYVVTHRWEGFPEMNASGRPKILIDSEHFPKTVEYLIDMGFKHKNSGENKSRTPLLQEAIQRPIQHSIDFAIQPINTIKRAYHFHQRSNKIGKEHSNSRLVNEVSLIKDDCRVTLQNHLGYTPYLWKDKKLRINPKIEQQMLRKRVLVQDSIFVSSPPYELVDLLCEGIYNYEGEFPDYHKQRCKRLLEEIQKNADDVKSLSEALNTVFYKADKVVLNGAKNGEFDTIVEEILSFTEY